MKLNQLNENISQFPDFSKMQFSEEGAKELTEFFQKIQKENGLKMAEIRVETHDEIGFVLTNNIFRLEVLVDDAEDGEFSWQITLEVDENYVIQNRVLPFNSVKRLYADEKSTISTLKSAVIEFTKQLHACTDWYFDLSGKYGKGKMRLNNSFGQATLEVTIGEFTVRTNEAVVY